MKKLYHIIVFLAITNFTTAQVSSVFSSKNTDFAIAPNGIYTVVNSTINQTTTDQVGAPQLPITTQNLPYRRVVSLPI